MKYIVCQIGSRQYLVKPGVVFEVDKLPDGQSIFSEKVLLWVEDGKIEVGKPFLKKRIEFEQLENIRKPKIRVAKYSPKSVSNRRVVGAIRDMSRLKLTTSI